MEIRLAREKRNACWFSRGYLLGAVVAATTLCAAMTDLPLGLLDAAKRGEVAAQLKLAEYYRSTDQHRKAGEWFEKAAQLGSSEAAYELGLEYQSGRLPPTRGLLKVPYPNPDYDLSNALIWISRAATANYGPACGWMGWFNEEGYRNGRPDVQGSSTTTIHEPTERNSGGGFFGGLAQGLGRSRDTTTVETRTSATVTPGPRYDQAIVWYRRGAELNDVRSMDALARFYEQGLGIEKSLTLALKWYQKAAQLGDTLARIHVESLLEHKELQSKQ